MRLTAAISAEKCGFVARCLETEVVSQGDTIEDARGERARPGAPAPTLI